MYCNQKGEIMTILTIGTFIIIGISTLVSSIFLSNSKNKQTIQSKAAGLCNEACYPCSQFDDLYSDPSECASANIKSTIPSPTLLEELCNCVNGFYQGSGCVGGQWGEPCGLSEEYIPEGEKLDNPINLPSQPKDYVTTTPTLELQRCIQDCKGDPGCENDCEFRDSLKLKPTTQSIVKQDYSDWAQRHKPTPTSNSEKSNVPVQIILDDDIILKVNKDMKALDNVCGITLNANCICIADDICVSYASYKNVTKSDYSLPPVPPFDLKAPLPQAHGGKPKSVGPYSSYIHVLPNLMRDDVVGVADIDGANVDNVINDTNTKVVRLAVSVYDFGDIQSQWSNKLDEIKVANQKDLEPRLVIQTYNLPNIDQWKKFLEELKNTNPDKLPSAIIFGNEVGGHDGGHAGDLTSDDISAGKVYSYLNLKHELLYDPVNGLPAYTAALYKTVNEIEQKTGKKIEIPLPSVDWNFEQVPGNMEKYFTAMQKAGVNFNDPKVTVDMHMFSAIEPPFPFDSSGPERIMEYKRILAKLGYPDTNIVIGELYYGNDFTPDQIYRYVTYYKKLGVKKITLYAADWQ